MKENKDRQAQYEFIALLQSCLDAYDVAEKKAQEVKEFITVKMPEKQQEFDTLREDCLHLLENYDLGDAAKLNLAVKIEEVSNNRRIWRNINEIARKWMENEKKLFYPNERPFLRNIIKQRIEQLDQDYKFRKLTEEEVSSIVNSQLSNVSRETSNIEKEDMSYIAKKRRKHLTKEEVEGINKMIIAGYRNKDIACKYHTTSMNISRYRSMLGV